MFCLEKKPYEMGCKRSVGYGRRWMGRKGEGRNSRLKEEHEQMQRGEEAHDMYPRFQEKLNYMKSQGR